MQETPASVQKRCNFTLCKGRTILRFEKWWWSRAEKQQEDEAISYQPREIFEQSLAHDVVVPNDFDSPVVGIP